MVFFLLKIWFFLCECVSSVTETWSDTLYTTLSPMTLLTSVLFRRPTTFMDTVVKFIFLRKVVRLFGAEVQKSRNLSTHESEECEHGKGVGVYPTLLQSDTLYYYIHMFAQEQVQACDRKRLFTMDR